MLINHKAMGQIPQNTNFQLKTQSPWKSLGIKVLAIVALVYLTLRVDLELPSSDWLPRYNGRKCHGKDGKYGNFPKKDDVFHFIPCTNVTLPPSLDDPEPSKSWSKLFDPNPENWIWGDTLNSTVIDTDKDSGRPIYLCGYLDVPLDYTNKSESRITRIGITKYQISGLSFASGAGQKSKRTILINPGGPGGSGTEFVYRRGAFVSRRLSNSTFDVLGWDPRGVNTTQPTFDCFPHGADRDRWSMLTGEVPESQDNIRAQLEMNDAMNEAKFRSCKERMGDLPRFVGSSLVARDMEQIRIALGEEETTAYMASYGTELGQYYANMFPQNVGRIILAGVTSIEQTRRLDGFSIGALDDATAAWREGFIGECVAAGPEQCALARPLDINTESVVTAAGLEKRLLNLLAAVKKRPIPIYTPASGPALLTYSTLLGTMYSALYNVKRWPETAQILADLERGNTTLAAESIEASWLYNPEMSQPESLKSGLWYELTSAVVCTSCYDAPKPATGMDWWQDSWNAMHNISWLGASLNFDAVLPCNQFSKFWPEPAEEYRGPLNMTTKNPVLLISSTHDPVTPLPQARKVLAEMGDSARLLILNGYGHCDGDESACTDRVARDYIMDGKLPESSVVECDADHKPYSKRANSNGNTKEIMGRTGVLWTNLGANARAKLSLYAIGM